MEYSNEIIALSLVGITRPGSKGLISALNIKAPHFLDSTNVKSFFVTQNLLLLFLHKQIDTKKAGFAGFSYSIIRDIY
jgi:hypothetical protein